MKFGIKDLEDLRFFQRIGTLLISYISGLIIVSITLFSVCIWLCFQTNIDKTLLIVLFSIVLIIRIGYRVFRNFYIHCKKDKKINIIIAIDSGLSYERFVLKRDFIRELEGNIDRKKFRVKLLPIKYFDKLYLKEKQRLLDKEYITKLNSRVNGNYRICGSVEKQKDDGMKCYIETAVKVFYEPIEKITEDAFNQEIGRVYEQIFSFFDNQYKSGIKFSGEYSAIVAQYIIGLACLISNDILNAREIHKDLYDEANKIKGMVEKGTTKSENFFKGMLETIKAIQWLELKCLTILSYYTRFDDKELSKYYKTYESWLEGWKKRINTRESLSLKYRGNNSSILWEIEVNNAIYEFVANRNVELSRSLLKKSKNYYKSFDYSIIFLDLYAKKYEWAKNRMKKVINKNNDKIFCDQFQEIIRFIDIVLKEDGGHEELLYWQALVFYKKLGKPLWASETLYEYLQWSKGEVKEYEIIPALELQKEIDKTIPVEDETFTYNK